MEKVPFRADVTRQDRRLVVSVSGELDYANSPQLVETLRKELADPAVELMFDFNKLSFLDSEGLKLLVRIYRRVDEAGGTVSITGCNTAITRLFQICGLTKILGVKVGP